jgi:hypothetical protein
LKVSRAPSNKGMKADEPLGGAGQTEAPPRAPAAGTDGPPVRSLAQPPAATEH